MILGVLILIPAQTVVSAYRLKSRLRTVQSFAFALGDGLLRSTSLRTLARYGLVVVDGEEATASQVAYLRAHGAIVLGYLSVGTIEKGRRWARLVAPYKLELWEDWGEWYADVSRREYRTVIEGVVAPWILKKGFDGIFLDNVDMIESHPAQRDGMVRLVATLRKVTRGKLLFSQNGVSSLPLIRQHLDGWNLEDVSATYDFENGSYARVAPRDSARRLSQVKSLVRSGLFVTTTDYLPASDTPEAALIVQRACAAGAVPFVSTIDLTVLPTRPIRCAAP
jgi:uncharacterized protein (TIGR01370 family)